MLHVTAVTAALAAAAARIVRLLPDRRFGGGPGAVVLRAAGDHVELSAGDGELSVRLRVPALVHEPGSAVVARRAVADTLGALDAPEVVLAVEGSRLALRAPGARFALPRLDAGANPVPDLPPPSGTVDGAALRAAVLPVAGAASREHALPIFTGVRIRSRGDHLSLLATDRFRLAVAEVPWEPAAGAIDVLVPAAALAELARQAAASPRVGLHAAGDRLGVVTDDGSVLLAALGGAYPDDQLDRLLAPVVEAVVEVEADALVAAVSRAAPYGGPHSRVELRTGDGGLAVHGSDPLAGESEEQVKASVRGDRVARVFKARLLLDAVRPFAGRTARLTVQGGLRAAVVTGDPGPDGVDLRYLVVPMRLADPS